MAAVFQVRAHAKAGVFSLSLISGRPLVLRAEIPAEPENGRANAALLSELEKALGCSVSMVAGHKSKKKTLAADCTEGQLIERINEMTEKEKPKKQ